MLVFIVIINSDTVAGDHLLSYQAVDIHFNISIGF